MPDTWLTPYITLWEQHLGAISYPRLAKAVKPAHDLLGDEACARAFEAFCTSSRNLRPEWFAPNCRQWAQKTALDNEPLVSPTGVLTTRGKRVYAGGA